MASSDQGVLEEATFEMSPKAAAWESERAISMDGGPEAGVGLACSWNSRRFCYWDKAGVSGPRP